MKDIIRFLLPPQRMATPPRQISADYFRGDITPQQQLVMMARLARDPARAQRVYEELLAEHGDDVFEYLDLIIKRQRTTTIAERFAVMVRRILGEDEPRAVERTYRPEAVVKTDYRHKWEKLK